MNMQKTKDVCFGLLLVFALLLDVRGFYISMNATTKLISDSDFTVSCRDNVEGLPVTWRNPKGAILGEKSRPKVEQGSFGTLLIFISPHKVQDSGNYTCSTEKDKRVFQLFVETPLEFADTATNQTGKEGEEFVIRCEVRGGTVTWFVEGGDIIENSNKYTILADGLKINNITRHDSKTYICKGLQQRTGTVVDRKIHFNVKHKPVHPTHPQRHMRQDVVYGYINGTVNLTCVVVAYPAASFEWKVSNKKQKIGQIINESPEVSILQLHIDSDAAFGNYKCIAKNERGSYEENFTLKKGVKPVPPSQFQVKETGGKSIMFEIIGPERTLEMDLETKGFSLQYRKIDDPEWKQAEFNITESNLYSLGNLESNSEYEVQAATRNLAGLSDYLPSTRWRTSGAASLYPTLILVNSILAVVFLENFNSAFW